MARRRGLLKYILFSDVDICLVSDVLVEEGGARTTILGGATTSSQK